MNTTKIERCRCLRCQYGWEARIKEPKACPRCKAREWWREADPRYIRKPAVRAEGAAR